MPDFRGWRRLVACTDVMIEPLLDRLTSVAESGTLTPQASAFGSPPFLSRSRGMDVQAKMPASFRPSPLSLVLICYHVVP